MAAAKENLEDFITCSVCLEKFEGRDPRFLPCGHAFCLTCIQDIHRTATAKTDNKLKDDEFRCPQCTAMSDIPGKSVVNYPKFFHATHMHDILTEINKGSNPSHWGVCQNDKDDVAGYCFTCKMSYCDPCLQTHNTTKRYNNHVYVGVNKDSIKSLICTTHNKLVEAYCTDCCKAVCAQCHLTGHRDHSISDFIINSTPLDHLPDFRKDSFKYKIQNIEKMQKEFNDHITYVHDTISKQEDVLIAQIKDQSKSLHAKLASHQADTNKSLDNAKNNLRNYDDLIDQAKSQITHLKQPIPELTSIRIPNIDTLMSDIQRNIPEKPSAILGYSKCLFKPQAAKLLLGTLSIEAQHLMAIEMVVYKLDICWTTDGDLLATVNNNLVKYDKDGEILPFDVVGVKGLMLAVSSNHSMVALIAGSRAVGQNLYTMSLSSGEQMRRVSGLSPDSFCVVCTDAGEVIIGANTSLLKFNTKGRKMWLRQTLHDAKNITITPDNKIVVSGGMQLSVHDQDGRWLSYFPKDPTTLTFSRGVCADSNGNVFVADSHRQAVLMYTSDGTYVMEVVKMDKQPQNIALHQDRYLAVADVLNSSLDVYDISQCGDL